MRPLMPHDVDRFHRKVRRTSGCHIWTAARAANGYGAFGIGRRTYGAHRVAWVIAYGPIPDGLWVLHRCDNRACVRPSHLFLGTHRDNMRDGQRKGRMNRGLRNARVKLTPEDIRAIRQIGRSQPQRITAAQFGVHQVLISLILRRKRWQHIDPIEGEPCPQPLTKRSS